MAKSYKGASKKAIHDSKVSQLDSLGTASGDLSFKETQTVIEQVVGDFVERVRKNIDSIPNFVTTGSINDIVVVPEEGDVNVYANPWVLFQDKGVSGVKVKVPGSPYAYTNKKPPFHVFKQWIKDKKLTLTDKNDYHRKHDKRLSEKDRAKERPFKKLTEEEKINNAAWGMVNKVYNEGFPARNIYSKEIPRLVEDLQKEVADFAAEQVVQLFHVKK